MKSKTRARYCLDYTRSLTSAHLRLIYARSAAAARARFSRLCAEQTVARTRQTAHNGECARNAGTRGGRSPPLLRQLARALATSCALSSALRASRRGSAPLGSVWSLDRRPLLCPLLFLLYSLSPQTSAEFFDNRVPFTPQYDILQADS